MKPVFIIEIKSSGLYFMTSIKGRYFRRIMGEGRATMNFVGKVADYLEENDI